jgi:hypothetical protein
MDGPLNENIQNDPMQSSMVRPFERSRKNILTRRANHRHIIIVARIKPAPEIRRGLFESDDALSGHALPSAPNLTDRRFRHCASHPSSTCLQAKPTQPSSRGRGHITGSPEGVRK